MLLRRLLCLLWSSFLPSSRASTRILFFKSSVMSRTDKARHQRPYSSSSLLSSSMAPINSTYREFMLILSIIFPAVIKWLLSLVARDGVVLDALPLTLFCASLRHAPVALRCWRLRPPVHTFHGYSGRRLSHNPCKSKLLTASTSDT